MFLEKLGITKKELVILATATAVLLVVLIIFISMMGSEINSKPTDLDFLGYKFSVQEDSVNIFFPGEDQFAIDINDETIHSLENLSKYINSAHDELQLAFRNTIILIYLLIFFFLLIKKKETHFQGLFKGFLLGLILMLLFILLQEILDVRSLLISFEHDCTRLLFH